MTSIALGRLERVDLRSIWTREDIHFTPWLAEEGNLRLLSEALGLNLELEAVEKDVGLFRADILCRLRDTEEDTYVLIENQLEATDHSHLGQLMTYAAGLDAKTIIWIAAKFTEEHRAAVDWLNHISADAFNFFGVEVELWRIGTSIAAPKFNIVAKPNNWSSSVSRAARAIGAQAQSETAALQLEFWTKFQDYLKTNGFRLALSKPAARYWANFGYERGVGLEAYCMARDGWLGVKMGFYGPVPKQQFKQLQKQQAEVDADIGTALDWQEMPDKKESRVILRRDMDPKDRDTWDHQFRWIAETATTFDRVLRPRIKSIVISEEATPAPADTQP
jgi:hypothetical protein